MNKFRIKAVGFWFVLLTIAIGNAVIRETTYKPWLTPYIGNWAHELSSLTGIMAFYVAIYLFLKKVGYIYTQKDLLVVGLIWLIMTLTFEVWMNLYIRKLSFEQVLETYYFWRGETWILVLISIGGLPLLVDKLLRKERVVS